MKVSKIGLKSAGMGSMGKTGLRGNICAQITRMNTDDFLILLNNFLYLIISSQPAGNMLIQWGFNLLLLQHGNIGAQITRIGTDDFVLLLNNFLYLIISSKSVENTCVSTFTYPVLLPEVVLKPIGSLGTWLSDSWQDIFYWWWFHRV